MLASSALLLSGCAANKLATFSAGDSSVAAKALPQFCEQILQPVKVTAVTPKTDARVAYVRAADERDEANDRLSVGGMCIRDERTEYAGKEKTP